MTTMCFIFYQMLKKQTENAEIFWPNSGHNLRGVGGGGQDGQWSHFPLFFFNLSFIHTVYANNRMINKQIEPVGLILLVTPQWPLFGSHCDQSGSYRPEEDDFKKH